jgi:hypothetical protein
LELAGKQPIVTMGSATEGLPDLPPGVVRQRTLSIAVWIIGFFIAIWLLGFNLAVPVATLLYLKIGGGEKWPITLALTVLATVFFYALFVWALRIPFPEGQIFLWV